MTLYKPFYKHFSPRSNPETKGSALDSNLARWLDGAKDLADDRAKKRAEIIADDALLCFILTYSPFLSGVAIKFIPFTVELFTQGPDKQFRHILDSLSGYRKKTINTNDLSRILRIAKQQAALTVAVADITGVWELEKITRALSDFAQLALSVAASQLLRDGAAKGAFRLHNPDDPEDKSGLIILAMGKLGAYELNYSSDIDIIILYDPERIDTDAPDALQNHFVRLARGLVKLMDERTVDGYVFRTDLRLRPDPGATPLAVSVLAAETYYESLGQNWERAAMIKARPVAGDLKAGQDFLKTLTPFIWRKYLDFAAIQDIHSIKRQINTRQGRQQINLPGHNIKLGIGGIREIEFFAQTQQLIWGGKEPRLRSSSTIETLKTLADTGLSSEQTGQEMVAAYQFLRTLEHRLQMINDEQTQTLPENDNGLLQLSRFMNFETYAEFRETLTAHLERVRLNYGQLFQESETLGNTDPAGGNLVFTGIEPDPETLETLDRLGYLKSQTIDGIIRAWHHGRHRAVRSTRAREILTEIIPSLLQAIAKTADPNQVFLRFDKFLSHLPAGVQLFSMFKANPGLLTLLADILGSAPRLGEYLSRQPQVLDNVLSADFFTQFPDKKTIRKDLHSVLEQTRYFEDVLDATRRFVHDRSFRIGVQQLKHHIKPGTASKALCDLADVVLETMAPRVLDEFATTHGHIPKAAQAIVALGKLGSREMTATSDLDLIFLYDCSADATSSDGQKPLSPAVYFARLSQRLINALTAETNEGKLFEVDMRLRPSGNSGPIATSFNAFQRYHQEQSWTWEHMALTRARVITASPGFKDIIGTEIKHVLCQQRDPEKLLNDVKDMRNRLRREKPATCFLSVKHIPGGLVDVEFIVQYLVLKHAHQHPQILVRGIPESLEKLKQYNLISDDHFDKLLTACELWQSLLGYLALTIEGVIDDDKLAAMPEALSQSLATGSGFESFSELEKNIRANAARVSDVYRDLIEDA